MSSDETGEHKRHQLQQVVDHVLVEQPLNEVQLNVTVLFLQHLVLGLDAFLSQCNLVEKASFLLALHHDAQFGSKCQVAGVRHQFEMILNRKLIHFHRDHNYFVEPNAQELNNDR